MHAHVYRYCRTVLYTITQCSCNGSILIVACLLLFIAPTPKADQFPECYSVAMQR